MQGILAPLYKLLGTMLYGFSSLFNGKYVFGLLIYALLFKLLFLPFSIKQQKNQIKMAHLAPKIELIKAKYKGRTDRTTMQKQQQEIMELQQKEGYSPFSGCGPMLLQLPIIMFLYTVIRNPLSYICQITDDSVRGLAKLLLESGHFVSKNVTLQNIDSVSIKSIDQIALSTAAQNYGLDKIEGIDFSRLPNFELFNTNLGENPSFNPITWMVIIPFLAAGFTWLSMFLTRKWNSNPAMQGQDAQANASMKMMDLMMPAMTLFMAFSLTGMMGIYWIYQSVLGILQTYIIARVMPLPKYTEEELKELKKAQKEAERSARSAAKAAPKYRSLHYIDDDEYENLPELQNSDNKTVSGDFDIPDIKD